MRRRCRIDDHYRLYLWPGTIRACSCCEHFRCYHSMAFSGKSTAPIIGHHNTYSQKMGVGIGGDYPLSAVISSEFAGTRMRGRMMTAVFSFQGWGNFSSLICLGKVDVVSEWSCRLAAALVGLIIVAAFKSALLNDSPTNLRTLDYMWRLLIGLGCIPGVIALYFRLTIPETPRFTMDIERNINQASTDVKNILATGNSAVDPDAVIQRAQAPKASWADFRKYFSQWKNLKILIGTSYSWFALDVRTIAHS